MSILKSIMHHWNKTTNSYDILHPETESSQITDWHSGIMASLASKTLGTVVDAITTDSVLGKLIKMLLDASGVKYLIDTNGYVCFGSLFGGLIIQWISSFPSSTTNTVAFPTSYSSAAFAVVGSSTDNANPVSTYSITTTGFSYNIVRTSNVGARFICIGV
jgi:hypothetical protein